MLRLIAFLGLSLLLFLFFRWLIYQPRRVQWQSVTGLLAVVLLLLVVTGRAHWLAAIFAALLPFVRVMMSLLAHVPLLQRVFASTRTAQSSATSGGGQTSKVTSRYINMTLDHETGTIDGEVLQGQFKGRTLGKLKLEELLELLNECQDDAESLALLQAYLDRVYEDTWRRHTGEQGAQQPSDDPGRMSRDEALQILGLGPDPDDEEIIRAHRRLMQNLHPDRGGSGYLAAKVNLAKETLLAR